MDGQPGDTAASEQPAAAPLSVNSNAAVPDPAALLPGTGADGESPPVRDPAAPPPNDDGNWAMKSEQTPRTAGLDTSEVQSTPAAARSEEPPAAAPLSEATDEAPSIPDDSGYGAFSLDDDPTTEITLLVPVVSVEGRGNTPEPLAPVITGGGPVGPGPHSAPPPAAGQPEPPSERVRSSSAMGGVGAPGRPSVSPGFRPYSETPVFSDSGAAQSPPPPPPETPDRPCSADWHHKTVDDLIAMDVPDVRIPRCVNTWGACEIRGWLRGLGLEQYVEAMLNNGICGRRLCLLTASNLPRLGITDWRHIRTITASARRLLSIDDHVPYERQFERPPPGPLTRALYLQCARPTGPPPPSSARYREFLRQHGFLDVLLELTNRPVVQLPQPQPQALYREIAVPPVPLMTGSVTSGQSQNGSPSPSTPQSKSPIP